MPKIKVVHIITLLELGGAQENTLYTCEHLDKNKFEPILICGKGGILDSKTKNIKTYYVNELIREIHPINDIIAIIKIYKIIKKEKPDIVHTHSSKAGIVGRWAAYFAHVPKIIHTFHGFGFHDYQLFIVKTIYVLAERLTAKITDQFICVSNENILKGLKNKIGLKERYTMIRSGIKLQDYQIEVSVEKKKKEFGITNEKVVGMVACFKEQKAPLDFVKVANLVCSKNPSVKFILVGDGKLRKQIELLVKKLNLQKNIIITGWRQDINEIIKIFDIFLLTSLWEGLPRVIIEAMASGLPVVATYVDGTKEIVQEGLTGYVTYPHEIEKMAERIIRVLADVELRKKLSEEAKKTVKEFDIDLMVSQQEKLYLSLAAN
ncbi:MAG: glycosyltransferase family 4 protein [Elusimicrobia bacterium]|nr:glycosyltransferase family 4 protein [Elusimicrobiota bacterium]